MTHVRNKLRQKSVRVIYFCWVVFWQLLTSKSRLVRLGVIDPSQEFNRDKIAFAKNTEAYFCRRSIYFCSTKNLNNNFRFFHYHYLS